jgi:hypothetical protein
MSIRTYTFSCNRTLALCMAVCNSSRIRTVQELKPSDCSCTQLNKKNYGKRYGRFYFENVFPKEIIDSWAVCGSIMFTANVPLTERHRIERISDTVEYLIV